MENELPSKRQQEGGEEEVYMAKPKYHQVDHVDLHSCRVGQSLPTSILCLQESNRKEREFIC